MHARLIVLLSFMVASVGMAQRPTPTPRPAPRPARDPAAARPSPLDAPRALEPDDLLWRLDSSLEPMLAPSPMTWKLDALRGELFAPFGALDESLSPLPAIAELDALPGGWSDFPVIDFPPLSPMSPESFAFRESMERTPMAPFAPAMAGVDWTFKAPMAFAGGRIRTLRDAPPPSWAPQDPADSLYRRARELLNRGDWRHASASFREIPQKYPTSAYAADALYWQAFSLYRIGATSELRDALAALDVQRSKYPNANTQADAAALATRIRGALAARGDAAAGAEVARTASSGEASCDPEEQAVRMEALSALNQTDPESVGALLDKVLRRKDECSVPLRRSAVFLVASRRDAASTQVIIGVARNDPSTDVRVEAIGWLARMPNEEAVTALDEILRGSDDERIQRAAVRALVMHPSPKARQVVRQVVERNDVAEQLRAEALSSFDREHATSEDVTWLRGLYGKLESSRLKVRALSAMMRIGGPEVDQLLATIVKNEDEPSEIRAAALRRLGQTMAIADLSKMYDGASERPIRQELINTLMQRKENEATDKLIDIVKSGTDPQLRREAIAALSRKKDPRTTRLLMEIIDK